MSKIYPSRVLRLLAAGQHSTVLKINLSDPRIVEIAGLGGVDAVWLCMEHVPNDWLGLENQICATSIHDMDTLVRVGRRSCSDYIRPLEAGATGIIVPHVRTESEAWQIVDWVRFHPEGQRAFDGGNVDSHFCLLPAEDYVRDSKRERIVILQIECPEALENFEKIAALPGCNRLLFGPGDYSHQIEKVGQVLAPEVVAARQRVARSARAHGKFVMAAGLLAPVAELAAEGHEVIGIGADVAAVGSYVSQRPEGVSPPVRGGLRSPAPSIYA